MPQPPQPPSPFAWPVLLSAAATLFPPIAAVATRRSMRRDPAGRVALAWGVVGGLNLLALGQLLGGVPRGWPVLAANVVAVPFLLAPPMLTWLGGEARRRQGAVLLAVAAAYALALATLGAGREFRLVAHPVMSLAVAALAFAVLCAAVRRADVAWGGRGDDGRLWIAGGVATYFLVGAAWRPLAETLFASNARALVEVHMGVQLAFAGCLTAVAWGVARRPLPNDRPAAPRASGAPAPDAPAPSQPSAQAPTYPRTARAGRSPRTAR
jgi:hypothetical protein